MQHPDIYVFVSVSAHEERLSERAADPNFTGKHVCNIESNIIKIALSPNPPAETGVLHSNHSWFRALLLLPMLICCRKQGQGPAASKPDGSLLSLPPLTEGDRGGGGRNTNTDGQTNQSKLKQMWQ